MLGPSMDEEKGFQQRIMPNGSLIMQEEQASTVY